MRDRLQQTNTTVSTYIDVTLSFTSLTNVDTTAQLDIVYYAFYGGLLFDGLRATVPSLTALRLLSMPAAMSTHTVEQSVDNMLYYNTRLRHFRPSVDRGSVKAMGVLGQDIRSAKNTTEPITNQDSVMRQKSVILNHYEASVSSTLIASFPTHWSVVGP